MGIVQFGFGSISFTPWLQPVVSAALVMVNHFNGFSCVLLAEAVETAI